jgi:DNA-binding CsgD family transcriptional regulator/tetratricopeptide (TPR) repeat protein
MVDLVDREAALEVLDAALGRAREGTGQVVVVTGEAGIGKTTLARHFVAGLSADVRALEGACDDLLTPRPLGPFHDIARRADPDLAALLQAGAGRDPVHRALLDLLARLPPPPVLLLEDLHWADEATLDAVALLGRRVADRPLLLLTTHRTDEVGPGHPLTRVLASLPAAQTTTLQLQPLTPAAVAHLADGSDVDPDRLHALTGGNPFYVTEVLAGGGLALPPSVGFAVTGRLGQLPEATAALLRVLALVPSRVDVDLLDRLDPAWPAVLEPAEAAGMVELRGSTLAFRHELARHAVAQTVPRMQARQHHARILAAMDVPEADAAALVHHAEGAGDVAALVRHARAAARSAHRAQSHREAVAHYQRALAHEDRLPPEDAAWLWLQLSRAQMAADHPEGEATEAARRAVELARDGGDDRFLGRTLANLSRIASWAGHNAWADRLAEEAVDRLEAVGPSAELAEGLLAVVYVRLAAWDFAGAHAVAVRAREVAEAARDAATVALSDVYLGVVETAATGDPTRLEAGIAACLRVGHREGAAEGFMTGTTALAFRRDHDRALALLDRGIEFAIAHEYGAWQMYMGALRAQVLAEIGQWDAADEQIRTISTAMRTEGWPRASALVVRGHLRARRGDPGAAEDLARAWAMAQDFGVLQLRHAAAAAIAELAWLEGRLDRAPAELQAVLAQHDVTAWPAVAGVVGLWLHRAGVDTVDPATMSTPYRLLVEGRPDAAAEAWARRGCVYEAAEAQVCSDDPDRVRAGLAVLDDLGALPLARRARARLRDMGVTVGRGPRAATRRHPAGLTQRQAEVLELMLDGATNAEIADRLVVSVRTVDHHVSAVLQKLGVASRRDVAAAVDTLGTT